MDLGVLGNYGYGSDSGSARFEGDRKFAVIQKGFKKNPSTENCGYSFVKDEKQSYGFCSTMKCSS
jgi:hypothetical protein